LLPLFLEFIRGVTLPGTVSGAGRTPSWRRCMDSMSLAWQEMELIERRQGRCPWLGKR